MRASFQGVHANAQNLDGTKERVKTLALVAVNPVTGDPDLVCELRYWAARSTTASNLYASLWVRCGTGAASGYGVVRGRIDDAHASGLAFDRALASAGISIAGESGPLAFAGAGDVAVGSALEAIARTLGYSRMVLV